MADFNHPYIDKVAGLELPEPSRAMITHGSALVLRGVRPARENGDIDLVVSQTNALYLADELGWDVGNQEKYYEEDLPVKIRYIRSPDGEFDAFTHDYSPEQYMETKRGRMYPDELFAAHNPKFDQDQATGIWVASVLHVAATMRFSGRKKDEIMLPRIDQYLQWGY